MYCIAKRQMTDPSGGYFHKSGANLPGDIFYFPDVNISDAEIFIILMCSL